MMTVDDEGLYKSLLEDRIALFEDCDVDCLAKGSQLTLVAGLNQLCFGIIALNALFMFIGAFRYQDRVLSVYCTFFACLFQFCIIVVSGVILCNRWNAVCSRSLTPTAGGLQWTMRDDFGVCFGLWIMSIILLFPFLFCGLQSTRKCEH